MTVRMLDSDRWTAPERVDDGGDHRQPQGEEEEPFRNQGGGSGEHAEAENRGDHGDHGESQRPTEHGYSAAVAGWSSAKNSAWLIVADTVSGMKGLVMR